MLANMYQHSASLANFSSSCFPLPNHLVHASMQLFLHIRLLLYMKDCHLLQAELGCCPCAAVCFITCFVTCGAAVLSIIHMHIHIVV